MAKELTLDLWAPVRLKRLLLSKKSGVRVWLDQVVIYDYKPEAGQEIKLDPQVIVRNGQTLRVDTACKISGLRIDGKPTELSFT